MYSPFKPPERGERPESKAPEYLVTKSRTYLAMSASLISSSEIRMAGWSVVEAGAVLHGELGPINISQSVVGECAELRPCTQTIHGKQVPVPMVIGDCVWIERDCVVEAASIGNFARIGARSRLGRVSPGAGSEWSCGILFSYLVCLCMSSLNLVLPLPAHSQGCVVASSAAVLPDSLVAPGTVVPPYAIYAGSPARRVGTLGAEVQDRRSTECRDYLHFVDAAIAAATRGGLESPSQGVAAQQAESSPNASVPDAVTTAEGGPAADQGAVS